MCRTLYIEHILCNILDIIYNTTYIMGFPGGSDDKESSCNSGDLGLIPGKGMFIHSRILVWRIPWTEEPGRLQFTGLPKSWTQLND